MCFSLESPKRFGGVLCLLGLTLSFGVSQALISNFHSRFFQQIETPNNYDQRNVYTYSEGLVHNPADKAHRLATNRIVPNRPTALDKSVPVILVPGDGGSQFEAKLDKPEVVHYFCDKKTDTYFDLWLNLELLVPYVMDCWVDNMRLVYNNETRTTSNSPGVDIRIPGFGNTTTVEWLDPSRVSPSAYFTNIVENLTSIGYERGISIRGAPYDFRKAPNELQPYLDQLKSLIEGTYLLNDGHGVVVVCHSMGCPLSLYLLNGQTQDWKDKYVKALVSLAAPWGGAVKAIKAFASGDNLGVIVINAMTVRAEQRCAPSTAFLLPSDKFWAPDDVLIETADKNYTVANYEEFFHDINWPIGYEMWLDNKDAIHDLLPPGVEVHCLYGVGIQTIDRMVYAKDKFPDSSPTLVYGDGDGTVNVRSLEGCLQWETQQPQPVYHQAFNGSDHMGILSDPRVLDYIRRISNLS